MKWLSKHIIYLGLFAWLLMLFVYLPYSPYTQTQVHVLLVAAPLFLIPLCFRLLGFEERVIKWSVAAALFFALAFCLERGIVTALLTLPWLLVVLYLNYRELSKQFGLQLKPLIRIAAFVFLLVGVAWAFLDRLGYAVMEFDQIIILLTAVHFHYAGFILTVLFYLSMDQLNSVVTNIIGIGLLAGAPLVAIGITGSQVGLPPIVESLCVSVMAMTGVGVGLVHLYLAWKTNQLRVKILWVLAGLCLLAGMTLAMLYGWRAHHQLGFLTIPWMYAVHGTLNVVGFAVPAVLANFGSAQSAN